MPTLYTSSGKIKFKTIPIYLGIKQINKTIAAENLSVLKKIMDKVNLKPIITYGTLLGAVREKDFITHDEDIDLMLKSEDKQALLDVLPALIEEGFEIARYDRRELLSIIRNGEYIDFYFFKPYKNNVRYCSGILCPCEFFDDIALLPFKGDKYWAPRNYEKFLVFEYGDNWMVPVKYNNYEMSRGKKFLLKIKEHVKDMLPDTLYFALADISAKKMEIKYWSKVYLYNSKYEI